MAKSALPHVLYSGHKESGLIRISLSIGLGGPGWARGLYMDRKRQRGPARPPCLKWNMPLLSPPGRSPGVRAFFLQGSNFCAIRELEPDPRCCSEGLPDLLPFLHCELPRVQPFVQQLRGPAKAPGKLGVRHSTVPRGHLDNLACCHSLTSIYRSINYIFSKVKQNGSNLPSKVKIKG